MKTTMLFNVADVINELEGSSMIKGSTLISPNELEVELSKLKDKWVKEFDDLSNFF